MERFTEESVLFDSEARTDTFTSISKFLGAVLRIRMFLGPLDSDPLVQGKDPDPYIIKQK
jgi:hypothetical protein